MKLIGWLQILIGLAILSLWPALIATGAVPEIQAGQRDIWFHIAAEAMTGMLLLAAGVLLLTAGGSRAQLLSVFGLGALAYTGINSAGHYAQLGEPAAVVVLLAVALVAAGMFGAITLRTTDAPTDAPETSADGAAPQLRPTTEESR